MQRTNKKQKLNTGVIMYNGLYDSQNYFSNAVAQGVYNFIIMYPMFTGIILLCLLVLVILALVYLNALVGNIAHWFFNTNTNNTAWTMASSKKPTIDYKALDNYDLNKDMHLFDKGNNFKRHFNHKFNA